MTTTTGTWTVDEFQRAGEEGRVSERSELVDGEVWEHVPPGREHTFAVNLLTKVLQAPDHWVSVQNPLVCGHRDQPEPDVALLRGAVPARLPEAADAVLVVEVAWSSLDRDRDRKVPLYARAGVPELWLVDLAGGRLVRHLSPSADRWGEVEAWTEGRLAPEAAPALAVDVVTLLGR